MLVDRDGRVGVDVACSLIGMDVLGLRTCLLTGKGMLGWSHMLADRDGHVGKEAICLLIGMGVSGWKPHAC